MWYRSENGSDVKPDVLDTVSSKKYVYVRRNFVLIPAEEERPAHWTWEEQKILKTDWAVYEQVLEHGEALDDVYEALTELAELIIGE
jgi:hypothetical protein